MSEPETPAEDRLPVTDLIAELLTGDLGAAGESSLLSLLAEMPAPALNGLLERVDADELLAQIDDRSGGAENRTRLIDMLSRSRVHELSQKSAAAVIYGMQRGRTTPVMEVAVRDILRSRKGAELTRLKNLIGDRTDRHDLEGLVYFDIDDDQVRAEILAHFAAQRAPEAAREVKVLCDVDDTVVCALHDRRYPRGTVYPGVLALLDALDRGPADEPFSTGDLTFITARPADALGLIEGYSKRALRRAGIADLDLLGGTLTALVSRSAMARQKIRNVEHYRALFPEYRVMFIGDSGQADPEVGERLHQEYDDIAAVLIHDVVGTPRPERERHAAAGMTYFDTYVGAACATHQGGLISTAGLEEVVDEAVAAIDDIDWDSDGQRAGIERLIHRDVRVAEQIIGGDLPPAL